MLYTKVVGFEVGKCEASKGVKDGQEGIFGSRASEKRRRGKERVYSKEKKGGKSLLTDPATIILAI